MTGDETAEHQQDIARPITVYLDTSSWSAVASPKSDADRDAVEILRALGAAGAVAYLVSPENIEEAPSSLTGGGARLEVMRAFPGAVAVPSASLLLGHDVRNLANAAQGASPAVLRINANPIRHQTVAGQIATAAALRPVHGLRGAMAVADQRARAANRGLDVRGRSHLRKGAAAVLHGDLEAVASFAGRSSLPLPLRIAVRCVGLIAKHAEARGWLFDTGATLDYCFTTVVWPYWPSDVSKERRLVQQVRRIWCDAARRVEIAPRAACAAAVFDRTDSNPQATFDTSEPIDILHAAFAPDADVFTCDKRTRDVLIRRNAPLATRAADVVPGHDLVQIANRVAERVEDRFSVPVPRIERGTRG